MPNEIEKKIGGRLPEETRSSIKSLNYLFVIGIDDYKHCPKLFNAVKDASEIVNILKEKYLFEEAYIHELYNEKATKKNIYNTLRLLATQITDSDNLIIYFSGHGEFVKEFELGYWIPVNSEQNAVDQYISNSEIKNILSAINSHHTFLMVDSCFSGSLFAKGLEKSISERKERDPSRWGLTSGRNEIVTDGKPGDNSPFAKSIKYQLENAIESIGVASLCDKVLEVVSANANQTPRGEPLQVEGHQGGQFVFNLKNNESKDWKATINNGIANRYQQFLSLYPNSAHAEEAKAKIAELKGDKDWQKIQAMPDELEDEISEKIIIIHKFLQDSSEHQHFKSAEDLCELLHDKVEFLQIKNNLIKLKRFSTKETHFKIEAERLVVQKEAAFALEHQKLDKTNNQPPSPSITQSDSKHNNNFLNGKFKYFTLIFFILASLATSKYVSSFLPKLKSNKEIPKEKKDEISKKNSSGIEFYYGTYPDAKNYAAAKGKLFFMYFTARWCTTCKWMEEATFTEPILAKYVSENYIAIEVDIDDFDGYELKQQFDINILPSLLIFNSKGDFLEQSEESLSPGQMFSILEKHNIPANRIIKSNPLAVPL